MKEEQTLVSAGERRTILNVHKKIIRKTAKRALSSHSHEKMGVFFFFFRTAQIVK